MYEIAEYLTDEEKARACAETYSGRVPRTGGPHYACPLGVALPRKGRRPDTPWSGAVKARLISRGRYRPGALPAIRVWIADWDTGRIPPGMLAEALGYTP